MGFYNIINKSCQIFFYFFILGEGGPRGHEHNLYEYATLLTIYIMGFSDSVYLIKERINKMEKETNKTIQSMTHLDSLRAVKVAIEMNELQDVTIEKLVNLVATMDKNMKLLATKVLELEKRYERS